MKAFITLLAVALLVWFIPAVRAADDSALSEPVKSILNHYVKIQTQLSKDSLKGVETQANAIAATVQNDATKALSPEVAKEAETLANAKDLAAAREAFKPLSASLIKYLADNKSAKGAYHQAYCPMANASWLQMGKDIRNPYMGKDMLECGELKD